MQKIRYQFVKIFVRICIQYGKLTFTCIITLCTYVNTCVCMYIRTYCSNSTAQFKVDRSHVWHWLNTTRFLFTRVHIRLMTSNLLFTALVYTLDVFMIAYRHTHACQEHMYTPILVTLQLAIYVQYIWGIGIKLSHWNLSKNYY